MDLVLYGLLKRMIDDLPKLNILNKDEDVMATTATVQTIATQYVVDNYARQPLDKDMLILTLTDKPIGQDYDRVLYIYSAISEAWANTGLDVDLTNYIATFAQTFSDEQKTQARTNIGAGTSSFSGSYTDLTDKPTIPAITLNGTETTTPTFYAPTAVGTNGQVLTSSGSGAPSWTVPIKKYTATNASISAASGIFTWTIDAATHGINNKEMTVNLYEVNSGNQVLADIGINQTNYQITISIVGTGTLPADTYRVVVMG